jgi:hypothetical protein
MTNVIDWILDLFRDPVHAQAFVNDPDRAMTNAGLQNVTAAQVQAVAATVAPAAVIHGGGNPVQGLQQAVAETHGIAFTPQHVFAPETQAFSNNDTLSHNDVLSNNDPHILSPEAGHDVQQGGVNLDFGDVTFGDKTTNTADHGGVVVNGDNDGDILTDGSVKQDGDHNNANTGDIDAGDHSPVIVGNGNDVEDNSQETGGGDIIQGNEGPVVKTGDIDTSGGGASGGDGGHGGGILTGGGATAAPRQVGPAAGWSSLLRKPRPPPPAATSPTSKPMVATSPATSMQATTTTRRTATTPTTRRTTATTTSTTRFTRPPTSTRVWTSTCSDREVQRNSAAGGDRTQVPASWHAYRWSNGGNTKGTP